MDEKAAAKLRTLPEEAQLEIISRLLEGQANGSIHNPSGFVVAAAVKASRSPAATGVMGRAGPGVDMIGSILASLGVDAEASGLLRQLPIPAQMEILGQLQELTASGGARNPSAWTARAANNYAKEKLGCSSLMLTRVGPPQHEVTAQMRPFSEFLTPEMLGVDEAASQVVNSLPPDAQQQLLAELKDGLCKGTVQNPSGWIVKAAKRRGAESTPGFVPMITPEQLGVDARASEMVRKLPIQTQRDILDLLAKGLAAGNVNNPSGFVVKKAMNARAGIPEPVGVSLLDKLRPMPRPAPY